eukprot:scaffold8474_cov258-Pinguiococcus_pyrenoidosus.AAC.5
MLCPILVRQCVRTGRQDAEFRTVVLLALLIVRKGLCGVFLEPLDLESALLLQVAHDVHHLAGAVRVLLGGGCALFQGSRASLLQAQRFFTLPKLVSEYGTLLCAGGRNLLLHPVLGLQLRHLRSQRRAFRIGRFQLGLEGRALLLRCFQLLPQAGQREFLLGPLRVRLLKQLEDLGRLCSRPFRGRLRFLRGLLSSLLGRFQPHPLPLRRLQLRPQHAILSRLAELPFPLHGHSRRDGHPRTGGSPSALGVHRRGLPFLRRSDRRFFPLEAHANGVLGLPLGQHGDLVGEKVAGVGNVAVEVDRVAVEDLLRLVALEALRSVVHEGPVGARVHHPDIALWRHHDARVGSADLRPLEDVHAERRLDFLRLARLRRPPEQLLRMVEHHLLRIGLRFVVGTKSGQARPRWRVHGGGIRSRCRLKVKLGSWREGGKNSGWCDGWSCWVFGFSAFRFLGFSGRSKTRRRCLLRNPESSKGGKQGEKKKGEDVTGIEPATSCDLVHPMENGHAKQAFYL